MEESEVRDSTDAHTTATLESTPARPVEGAQSKRLSRKRMIIFGAIGIIAALALGIGIAMAVGKEGMASVAEAPADPTATPTETESPVESEAPVAPPEQFEFNVDSQVVESYLAESQETFMARPVEERLLVALSYAEDMPKFAEDWYSVSQNKLDILPATILVENTPQEIVTITGYMHRMPPTLPTKDSDFYLDTNAAYKMIGGSFINGTGSSAYLGFVDFIDRSNTAKDNRRASARTLAASNYMAMPLAGESSDLLTDNAGNFYRTIAVTEVLEGNSKTSDVVFRWVTAANGVGMWVQD